jgi:hypothetical protein
LLVICGLVFPSFASSGDPASDSPAGESAQVGNEAEQVLPAIDRGLAYLASKQNKVTGSWHSYNQAVNALALLAFMGRGHVPARGPYRDVVERGKDFLLGTRTRVPGYLSFGTMYEHGLATLALAEMYGMDADPLLEEKLRQAIDLIVRTQSAGGGWNYEPAPADGDLSVSVMQIVALRAAMNAEIPVPAKALDKAIAYVQAHADPAGGFGYTGPGRGPGTTAAGILSLQLLGKYDDPRLAGALNQLDRTPIAWGRPRHFFYFHYYAIQARYQAGGKYWAGWHSHIRDMFLKKQNADGSWEATSGSLEDERAVGGNRIYWTAMACLVLDIYMHYLPAYQR